MSKPIAVLISDVHYNIHTLKLADAAMNMAIDKANILGVPLIVAGDLHDTKANLRGECVNAMVNTFAKDGFGTYILIGNHDKINEKSEDHSLNFLENPSMIIDRPYFVRDLGLHLIPYQHDPNFLKSYIKEIPKGSTIIMHQGIEGSNSGEYIQDKSAISTSDIQDFRVISGHYHTRQDIKCGRPRQGCVGLASYIGNPYTLTYAEANDPPKGFQILYNDGTLEFVPTNLRRHRVYEIVANNWKVELEGCKEDLVWLKITGTKEELSVLSKAEILEYYSNFGSLRLDLIPLDTNQSQVFKSSNLTQTEIFDLQIENLTNTSNECKLRLKELWRGLCE